MLLLTDLRERERETHTKSGLIFERSRKLPQIIISFLLGRVCDLLPPPNIDIDCTNAIYLRIWSRIQSAPMVIIIAAAGLDVKCAPVVRVPLV